MEDRTARKEIRELVSALKPGEPDPYADRKVDPSEKGKYKQIIDPTAIGSTAGLEIRGGYLEKPITVKL